MNIKKHVGRLANTGTRVVVVYRKIPDNEGSCLVVESDRLPDMYHDNLMHLINSKQGQDTTELYEVLNRNRFADGLVCLQALHGKGFLKKVDISQVEMMPMSNHIVPLEMINDAIDGKQVDTSSMKNGADTKNEDLVSKAESLLAEAKELDAKAETLRNNAYSIAPELKPKRGRPTLTEDEKTAKKAERAKKRREKYAAEKKTSDTSDIDAKLAERLKIDSGNV